MNIITHGRTDVDDYFRLSGVLNYSKLAHTPFLALVQKNGDVEVFIVESARDLLRFPDDTPVMAQWRGQYRSDFFRFTVKDVRDRKGDK